MEIIVENFEYIVIFFIIIFFVLTIIILALLKKISKFFNNNKFRIYAGYDYEPMTDKKEFTMQIFNNNINDARVVGFGFMYKEQTIDYYKTYQNLYKLDQTKPIVILSRDSLKLSISSIELENIISNYNLGRPNLTKIYSYTTDSQGRTTKQRAGKIRKVISNNLKIKNKEKQSQEQEINKRLKLEKKEENKKQRLLIIQNQKDKLKQKWLVIKTKLRLTSKNKS